MSETSPSPDNRPDALATPLSVDAPLPLGESQWAMISREFRKRRSAVIYYWVVVILASISIFAPFLANNRPIAYFGFARSDYAEQHRTARLLIGQLATPLANQVDELARRVSMEENLRDRLQDMREWVTPEGAAELDSLQTEVDLALGEGDAAARGSMLASIRQKLTDSFSPRSIEFQPQWRFPVFASLAWTDLLFMTFAFLFVLRPLWAKLLALKYGRLHPAVFRWSVGILLGLPALAAVLWIVVVPKNLDRINYKQGTLAAHPDASLSSTPVVYHSVLWPPIPSALDETDLSRKTEAPRWWPVPENEPAAAKPVAVVSSNGLPQGERSWLGTDSLGRDLLCRMIWGGRVSLAVGVVAVSIYMTIGIIVGGIAGYFGGWTDMLISRVIEIVICFPSFFLILTVVAFVGSSIFNIMVVIGVTSWTGVARLVRAEFLRLSDLEFVQAGRALGYSAPRLIFRHILPNAMAPVLVAATFGIAGAILTESGLSFLGLGIQTPTPSWGGILHEGRDVMKSAPWIIQMAGLAIFVTIYSYNVVGEAFRDAADPRLRGQR